jgi:hypothetical protein
LRSTPVNQVINEISADCGGNKPVQLGVRRRESEATVKILDSMAGQIQDRSVSDLAVTEESLDLLGDKVRPLVYERLDLVPAYGLVSQEGR